MDYKVLNRLDTIRRLNENRSWINRDLYRLLYDADLYKVAYQKIKSKPGNMTPGTDGKTLDGFSEKTVGTIISQMRDESFKFTTGRRKFIPKANGGQRPLTVSPPREKVVQEALRMILEAVYKSTFLDTSHAYIKGRGTHTALKEIRKWQNVTWYIEGDIKGCYDNINHHRLIEILRERIQDERFINLIWKSLKAGYMTGKTSHNTLSGTPQGSIVSPILSNIYLHKLDVFMAELQAKYNKGGKRSANPEYKRVQASKRHHKKMGNTQKAKELDKYQRSIPSVDPNDPNYIRVYYCRYADDWIVGVVGPQSLAITIRDEIRKFLQEELKLELSLEKTHIRHARSEKALFLGTNVGTHKGQQRKVIRYTADNKPTRRRGTGWQTRLEVPMDRVIERLHQAGLCDAKGFPIHKSSWVNYHHHEIINLANAVMRGYRNYYSFVDNYYKLSRLEYIIQFSVAKTLAAKFKMKSIKRVFGKFGRKMETTVEMPNGEKKTYALDLTEKGNWKAQPFRFNINPVGDVSALYLHKPTRDPLGGPCIVCGNPEVEMHHVRHIRKMGQRLKGFHRLLAKLNRKQIPVCVECHQKIHSGKYDGLALKDLTGKPN